MESHRFLQESDRSTSYWKTSATWNSGGPKHDRRFLRAFFLDPYPNIHIYMKYWSLWCSASWTRPRWTLVNSCIGYRLPIHHLGQFPLLCHSRTNSFLRWEVSTAPSLRQPLLSFPPQKHVRIHQANLPRMVIDLEVMLPQGVWATTHLKMDLPDAPPGREGYCYKRGISPVPELPEP